ncbi:hypothetical protein HZU77_010715 [Neisseriaceae bacterium TC5R-5]|nr:hypothetical protein [Neisseriaceae bacterium TC5R-5]
MNKPIQQASSDSNKTPDAAKPAQGQDGAAKPVGGSGPIKEPAAQAPSKKASAFVNNWK